jgi:hypothetical protein
VKYRIGLLLFSFFISYGVKAQSGTILKGKVIDEITQNSLENVKIAVLKTNFGTNSSAEGTFELLNFPKGEILVEFSLSGYESKIIPIENTLNNPLIDLLLIRLTKKIQVEIDESFISLNEQDLYNNEGEESNSISGLLVATKDVFLRTVAYEFSPTFFRQRNLGSENSSILLNGMAMNKIYNGRPQWSNWGGLNDVLRNQEFFENTSASTYNFGGFASTTNMNTRASEFGKGVKVSYAASNRSYTSRIMATYSSGVLKNGWSFVFSGSYRFGKEGFKEGTLYDAKSFFASIEKEISDKHSFNFTTIYASNIRGKASPLTQEVFNLKSIKYNAYWGKQNLKIRNSRTRKIVEPILQFNHYWKINSKSTLHNNITYQFGKVGNSRLDYGGTRIITANDGTQTIVGGGTNPDPTYYQKLPSYFLRDSSNPDYANAYLAEQEFLQNGEIKWKDLYEANQNSEITAGNSIYALYEDRNDDKQLNLKSIFFTELNSEFHLNATISYTKFQSENFASMLDLLGGNSFLDVDLYSDNISQAQSDLQNPNRLVTKNDMFKYNYILDANLINVFTQTQYHTKKGDVFLGFKYSSSNYQRTGLYENGAYPGNFSLGKSEVLQFSNFGIKSGFTYKLSGRHIFTANATWVSKAPTLQNSFSNSRENNDVVIGLIDEKNSSFDINYYLRHPKIMAKVSAYFIEMKDQSDISFYFADGISGIESNETTAFVQEVLTGINTQNIGIEIGLEVPVITSVKLKAVAAIGQSVYTNNPSLYLTSDDFLEPLTYDKVYLKNYFVAGGPQQAYSFGFEYSSPKYWWLGMTTNYFTNAFVNIAPILRTNNFYLDSDGLPIENYDPKIARELLKQEKFASYFLVNIVGGKSWKINDYYVGFFANVGNILNSEYKTGGFEQSRNANYNNLLEDKSRENPLFGSKYWFGYGTSYYAQIYFRF